MAVREAAMLSSRGEDVLPVSFLEYFSNVVT